MLWSSNVYNWRLFRNSGRMCSELADLTGSSQVKQVQDSEAKMGQEGFRMNEHIWKGWSWTSKSPGTKSTLKRKRKRHENSWTIKVFFLEMDISPFTPCGSSQTTMMANRVDNTHSYYFTESVALFTRKLPVVVSYTARQHFGKLLNSKILVRVACLHRGCVSRCTYCFYNNKNICHS